RRRTQARRSFREPRPSPFLCAVRTRFERRKEPLKPSGFTIPSWRMMSPTTRRVAVAVRARTGMPPSSCLSPLSLRYAGRKSWPHSEMQCASSTTTSDTFTPAREARRDLEGERLPRARRHDADAVAPREDGRDDLLLPRAEVLVAEDAGQDVAGSEAGRERELIDACRIAEMSR